MREIRIGVIGLKFGQYHVQTLANMPGVRIVGLADRSAHVPGGLDAYAARYGARAYEDGMEMIESGELDAVTICTSPRSRAPLIEASASRQIPMFVEKPWAGNWAQATMLADLCQENQARVMVGFSFRFHPAVMHLIKLIQSDLGPPQMLNGEYLFEWIPDRNHWLWDKENGGGFFNENSCHLFDTVCHLMGKPESVFAEGITLYNSPSAEAAVVSLRFRSGALACMMIGGIGANGQRDYPRLNLITQSGQVIMQGREHCWESLSWTRRGENSTRHWVCEPESLGNTRYTHALNHFVEQIRNNGPFTADIEDGLLSVAIAEAVYQSIKTGQKIELEGL